MYIRRVFYDPTTGAVLYVYTQQGDFEYTQPAVMAALYRLFGRGVHGVDNARFRY